MIPTQVVTQTLSTLTLITNVMIVICVFIYGYFALGKQTANFYKLKLVKLAVTNARILAFIVALAAMLGSLFYSDIAGFTPCKLCWYQRILMYPQVILLGLSIIKNERKHIADYCLTLSGIGTVIAIYHYWLQRGGNEFIPCSTVGYSVSCSDVFVMSYGYITIPFMSLSAFLLIIGAMILLKRGIR